MSSSVEPISLRHALRAATSGVHSRLDSIATGFRLETPAGYARFLAAQAAALLPMERALREAGIEDILPDWPERVRGAELTLDLFDLGAPVIEPLAPPTIGCDATAFGAVYVLEGSRLGAQAILPLIVADMPTRFLRHGAGKRLWPRFVERLEDNLAVRERPRSTEAGAIAAFELFERAFLNAARSDLAVAAR